jgi:hypothetical protein
MYYIAEIIQVNDLQNWHNPAERDFVAALLSLQNLQN